MKKIFYITLFTLLGIIVSFLVHAVIEIPVIYLLVSDFERFGAGLSWNAWYMIHFIGTVLLFVLGVVVGFRQGVHWWQVIYIERRFGKNI